MWHVINSRFEKAQDKFKLCRNENAKDMKTPSF